MSLIQHAYKHHDKWLEIARKFVCCEFEYDIVQEMYINLETKYNEEKALINGNINEGLCYIIIRNLCFNLNKAQSVKMRTIDMDADLSNLSIESESYDQEKEELFQIIENEKSNWPVYDRILFDQVYHNGISMRKISRESDIGIINIFNTMKYAKERIRIAAEKKRS